MDEFGYGLHRKLAYVEFSLAVHPDSVSPFRQIMHRFTMRATLRIMNNHRIRFLIQNDTDRAFSFAR